MRVRVLGVKDAMDQLRFAVDTKVSSVAEQVETIARSKTPIKSGNARRNWNTRKGRQGFTVDNRVPYIGRLEEGYSKQAPQGIIQPTLRAVRRRNLGK